VTESAPPPLNRRTIRWASFRIAQQAATAAPLAGDLAHRGPPPKKKKPPMLNGRFRKAKTGGFGRRARFGHRRRTVIKRFCTAIGPVSPLSPSNFSPPWPALPRLVA